MKKNFTLILLLLISIMTINAQVAKKVVVEHFTNTKCGICSSRNPGFYKNLKNFPDVLHLSIHPSSPYAACKLSQQNNPDNDDRTKYYNVYGGTPRLVIQGKVISANEDYNSSTLFTSEENQIDAKHIKNLPEMKAGKSIGGPRLLGLLNDVNVSGATDSQVLTYNSDSKVWEAADSTGGGGGGVGVITSTVYNASGQITSTIIDGVTQTITYNTAGQVDTVTIGDTTYTYTYNANGTINTVS